MTVRWMRRLGLALALGVVACLCPRGGLPRLSAQPAATVAAPKWDVGDQWTWYRGPDELTHTVIEITSNAYTVQVKAGTDVSFLHMAFDLSSSSSDSDFMQLQFPLVPGKQWTYTLDGFVDNRVVSWNVTRKVEGAESVTVPAGIFDAIRVSGRHCNVRVGNCGDFIAWYAPKVKYIAKITWSNNPYWPSSLRGASQVLISYAVRTP